MCTVAAPPSKEPDEDVGVATRDRGPAQAHDRPLERDHPGTRGHVIVSHRLDGGVAIGEKDRAAPALQLGTLIHILGQAEREIRGRCILVGHQGGIEAPFELRDHHVDAAIPH